jgi:hypothetical protein
MAAVSDKHIARWCVSAFKTNTRKFIACTIGQMQLHVSICRTSSDGPPEMLGTHASSSGCNAAVSAGGSVIANGGLD